MGDCFDNAMAEIFCYVEGWYNPKRRHSAISYQSPVNFEKAYCEAA